MLVWTLLVAAHAACPEASLPEPFDATPDASDDEGPGRPVLDDVGFRVDLADGCSDCADALVIRLDLGGTEDGLTNDEVGYLVKVIDGALPDEVRLPTSPFRGPEASFTYLLEPATLEEDLAVQLELRAVDVAGNVSSNSLVVDVRAEGRPAVASACAHTGATWSLLGVGLVGAARRRRVQASR